MDILVGAVIIIVLLFCLGASVWDVMALGVLCLGGVLTAMALFFLFCAAVLFTTKRVKAEYLYIDKEKRGFPKAYYGVGDEVYPNVFPCEMVMRERIYKTGKPVFVRLQAGWHVVFDTNAIAAVVVGTLICVPAGAYSVYLAAAFLGAF